MNTFIYTTYDLPVEYKKLKIYPVTVKDMLHFNTYSQCLTIDKNSIPNPEIISMTYLEYIYHSLEEEHPYLFWFDRLLSLCLKDDKTFEDIGESIKRYGYSDDRNPIFIIGDDIYNSDDFDEIKNIIAFQNMVELIDENISKEVRDSLEKARDFKRRISGEKSGSTEDYIISLAIFTGWNFEYIMGMTIRKFIKCIRRMDVLIHYKIYMGASMSGMVDFKDKSPLRHWMRDLEDEDKYKDVSVDYQEIEDKISFEAAKKAPQ